MSLEGTEKIECAEFLEFIRYTLAIDLLSSNWDIETDLQKNSISLTIKSSKNFVKNEIKFIVDTIADYELFKFHSLRELGWCSSSKIIESSPGYLEFSWLNLRKSENFPIEKCSCQICVEIFSECNN